MLLRVFFITKVDGNVGSSVDGSVHGIVDGSVNTLSQLVLLKSNAFLELTTLI